jgi:hypothetical protein
MGERAARLERKQQDGQRHPKYKGGQSSLQLSGGEVMKFAYADIRYDDQAGRWVAELHNDDGQFYLQGVFAEMQKPSRADPGTPEEYTFMVKYNPDDQFAYLVTPEQVEAAVNAARAFVASW